MGIVNWRREGLFLAIAGMETCWVVGGTRVLLGGPESNTVRLSWWSVWVLYIVALVIARVMGRLKLQREPWLIGALALFTSLLLLMVNLGHTPQILRRPNDPSTAVEILTLLLGFLIWFRALRIPAQAGYTRAITRHFQVGVLIMAGLALATLSLPALVTDLVATYFGFGLLAMALTRIEEVAQVEPSGAAPFNLKWVATLTATLLVVGATTLLATQVITVETARWLLRPFVTILSNIFFVLAVLSSYLVMQLLPLLQWLFSGLSRDDVEMRLEDLRQSIKPFPQEESDTALLSPELLEALRASFIVILILITLWVLVRSFRRWRMRQYATPGGVRETVAPEGTLAQDLADFFQDRWRRLQQLADLRRLFQRWGTGSARAIYANLLALLAAADRPRQPEQTPYEYQPVAEDALPPCQAEVKAITEAYVRAHYGEMEISPGELAHLQEAWKRIRAEGENLL